MNKLLLLAELLKQIESAPGPNSPAIGEARRVLIDAKITITEWFNMCEPSEVGSWTDLDELIFEVTGKQPDKRNRLKFFLKWTHLVAESELGGEPPALAEFLAGLFASKKHRQAVLGDLEEKFNDDLARGISIARARRRYWASALHSVGPLLLASTKKIALIGAVVAAARKLLP
jgi:hypothetical protein